MRHTDGSFNFFPSSIIRTYRSRSIWHFLFLCRNLTGWFAFCYIFKVIGINQAKIAQIRDALITLQNGITDGTGSLHKPLYEAYADKVSRIFTISTYVIEYRTNISMTLAQKLVISLEKYKNIVYISLPLSKLTDLLAS